MALPPSSILLLLLLLVLLAIVPSARPDDPSAFVFAGCSQPKPSSPSPASLNSLLASIANAAAASSFANFTSSSVSSPVLYGLFQCRGDLPAPSCAACVRGAIDRLALLCPSASSAALQLRGCLLRYDNSSFFGQPDRTLLFKKCGPGAARGGPGPRDAALAAVAAGPQGQYRSARSGGVEAAAQCVGDQGARQCDECVATAVDAVKDACGATADAGEVYLGKCYVGYYDAGGVAAAARSHGKESAKNIAIVVGIAVAVLFLVLLFYFLRRNTGGKLG